MQKINYLFLLFALLVYTPKITFGQYDPQYVDISTVIHKGVGYDYVGMTRTGKHVNAKYFGEENGNSAGSRFNLWKNGRKIICVFTPNYIDWNRVPVGLTIDNGKLVNRTLESFDGLVVVYATGGIVVSNLKNADLTVQGGTIPAGTKLDLRNNPLHLQMFIDWAYSQKATVFQTHLFVYKNVLDQTINDEQFKKRERRFLAVGTNASGQIIHSIINSADPTTLKEGAKRTLDFLNARKKINVIFMINLDPGAQNVFFLYDENGKIIDLIKGTEPLDKAANLLVYYQD